LTRGQLKKVLKRTNYILKSYLVFFYLFLFWGKIWIFFVILTKNEWSFRRLFRNSLPFFLKLTGKFQSCFCYKIGKMHFWPQILTQFSCRSASCSQFHAKTKLYTNISIRWIFKYFVQNNLCSISAAKLATFWICWQKNRVTVRIFKSI
jgi:hypothetical protein